MKTTMNDIEKSNATLEKSIKDLYFFNNLSTLEIVLEDIEDFKKDLVMYKDTISLNEQKEKLKREIKEKQKQLNALEDSETKIDNIINELNKEL